jgi:hypothetical protein
MACEVHLDGNAPNRDAVEILMHTSSCLFVYVDEGKDGVAKVSDQLPEKYVAAVAFLGGPIGVNAVATTTTATSDESGVGEGKSTPTTSNVTGFVKQPLQCITLLPTIMLNQNQSDVEESLDADESKQEPVNDTTADASAISDVASANGQAALLQALQLYSRKLFLPSLKDQTTLQEKIRQLNVAIGQSQRSAKLPSVTLQVDSQIVKAITQHAIADPIANVDWNHLGMQPLLQDDDYLNALQSGVSEWIAQIRKLTVLPKSTTFPLLDQAAVENTDDNTSLADLEEINFWNALSHELNHVHQQLASPPMQLTLAMLREAKRYVLSIPSILPWKS